MTDAEADVRRDLRNFIEDNFLYLHPDVDLGDADNLLKLGLIDSLGFVELVEEVQSRFGLAVDDLEITEENFASVDAITAFVRRKQSEA
jgi:acyl carrier protein